MFDLDKYMSTIANINIGCSLLYIMHSDSISLYFILFYSMSAFHPDQKMIMGSQFPHHTALGLSSAG